MIEEFKKAAKYISALIGADEFTEKDFVYAVSYKANELSPEKAKILFSVLLSKKIIKKKGNTYTLNFNPRTVALPVDYTIPHELLSHAREDIRIETPFERILKEMSEEVGTDRKELIARANRLQAEMGKLITPEAALVVVGTALGANPKKYAGLVKEELVQNE